MPVKLQLAASCLKDMPTPGHAAANPTKNTSAIPKKRHLLEPDVSEWSGLLLNEQEVAVHPVQALDVCMASSSNSIELTPLWPKSGSPSHCMRGGSGGGGGGAWPADHKPSNTKNGGQRAPPPPPPKNQPPPHPPQLPVTSSREFQLQRKQQQQHQELSTNNPRGRLHHPEAAGGTSESKGPAPQPPQSQHSPSNPGHTVTSQPLRNSASVSRGLQVEEDDLIQFNNGQKASLANGSVNGSAGSAALSAVAAGAAVSISTSASVAQLKKQLRSRLSLDQDDDLEADEDEASEEEEETASEHRQTADENMDYLEGLEPCPCYAKCCLDSLISLFCVTVLG